MVHSCPYTDVFTRLRQRTCYTSINIWFLIPFSAQFFLCSFRDPSQNVLWMTLQHIKSYWATLVSLIDLTSINTLLNLRSCFVSPNNFTLYKTSFFFFFFRIKVCLWSDWDGRWFKVCTFRFGKISSIYLQRSFLSKSRPSSLLWDTETDEVCNCQSGLYTVSFLLKSLYHELLLWNNLETPWLTGFGEAGWANRPLSG